MKQTPSLSNKITIEKFMVELDLKGLTERRKKKYRILLKKFSRLRLSKLTQKNAQDFFILLKNSDYSDDTKVDYWYMFKTFFKWLNPKVNLSQYKLKTKFKHKLPEEILTLEEVRKLIVSYKNLKFRTQVSLLYDSGCRPSELLGLHVRDVIFDTDGVVILFNGKTGPRRIRIITSTDSDKFLKEYMKIACPEDLVFGHMTIERLNQIVKEQASQVGITKRVYSYIFRHSRATHLAPYFTEQQLKVYMGWSMASKMVATYVHMSGKDIDNRVMELNNNPVAFIPSDGFKEFMYEMYNQWSKTKSSQIATEKALNPVKLKIGL